MVKEPKDFCNLLENFSKTGIFEFCLLYLKNDETFELIYYSEPLTSLAEQFGKSLPWDQILSKANAPVLKKTAKEGKGFQLVEYGHGRIIDNYKKILSFTLIEDYVALLFLPVIEIPELIANISGSDPVINKLKSELSRKSEELELLKSQYQKRNEEFETIFSRLISSEELLHQFADNTDDILLLRSQTEILYVNDSLERITGIKREDLIRSPDLFTEQIHPEDRQNFAIFSDFKYLTPGKPMVYHSRFIKSGGEVRWLGTRIFPIYDEKGKPYRLMIIASDITDQKDFEEALKIAKKNAQESDKLKSTFLANISHEIRTPMNGILGFAELITRDDLNPDLRKNYFGIIKKSSDQLVRIIDDIIDFSKIESNQMRVLKSQFSLNTLLDEIFIFFRNYALKERSSSVALLLEKGLDGDVDVINSDEHRIRQILNNLIENAIKYTEVGYVKFGYTQKHDKLEFFVSDSGIGIPKDMFERIFERFRQIDEGPTRKFGGTGLGLPITRGLVNLLGGSIWIESEINKGTTFYFTIPYKTESKIRKQETTTVEEDKEYDLSERIILVAEDDDLNYEYIETIFESTHAQLIRAKDGSQAISICSTMNFDLILMDIRLPVLNGIEATERIRSMGIKTPIIAQTAFALDDDEKRCLAAGCNKYITKPISKEKLFEQIHLLLS